MAPPVFKTGLAANIVAGGFDSLPPPPSSDYRLLFHLAYSRRTLALGLAASRIDWPAVTGLDFSHHSAG